ncbi:hypothetical protein C3F09_06255, partial [candidate division GN15 bacterium]
TASGLRGSKASHARLTAAVSDAEFNYDFVKSSHIPHNIRYSLHLLNSSADRITSAIKEISSSVAAPQPAASVLQENSCLTFCHANMLLPETVDYSGKKLPHQMHAKELDLGCKSCHSVSEHGKTQINKEVCTQCHEGGM